jgi:predicted Rossmann fold flavoprotein
MKGSVVSSGSKTWDVVVIGGGPAGMMAAGRAAERGLSVLLLEKNEGLGKKLLITGGGRCNVTNAELDDRALLAKFKDDGKFLFSAFSQYSVEESLAFFNGRGMPTKVENEKRVFPISDSAKSVWDVLLNYMKAGNVTVRSNAKVTGFVSAKTPEGGTTIQAVKISGGEKIEAKRFILATGGMSHPETGSTGEGFEWLRELGHTVSEPSAALVPITVSDAWVKALSGVTLPKAKVTLFQNGVKQAVNKGKVLFTHFGLSGPGILNMSAEVADLMKYGEVVMSLDLLPDYDYSALNESLQRLFTLNANKKFKNSLGGADGLIPSAFVSAVLEISGLDGDTECNSITREERLNLVKVLKDMPIKPTGFLGAEKAIITAGGVALTEVDFKTMRSRLVPNLSLVGDILDIDRPSGGYSLQLCWTTGWVAGNSI